MLSLRGRLQRGSVRASGEEVCSTCFIAGPLLLSLGQDTDEDDQGCFIDDKRLVMEIELLSLLVRN